MWRSHRANDEEECGGDDDGRDASIDLVIDEVVEIGQWNLYGKPKKVVFTMKDGWFRVDVRVGQPHESAIFTLWDRECYALIKETVTEIKQKMIDMLSDDDAFIKFVLSKLPTLQHHDEASPSISMMNEINDVSESQCFSATAESDPTLLGSITSAKCILPLSHSQLDGIPFEDLSSIQLSSTRLGKKHIKIE
ncbi:hypothetical protein JHK87_047535 [Glycine soja]|nr:hypothetical protein JHK87_047535 [Glycine soja]